MYLFIVLYFNIISYYYSGRKLSTHCIWRNVSMSNVCFIIKYINLQILHFHCQMSAAVLINNFCDQNRPIQFFHIRRIYMYNLMCRTINPMYVLIKLKIASVWTSPSTQSQAFGWRWGEDYCCSCIYDYTLFGDTFLLKLNSVSHKRKIFKLRDLIVSSVLY